MFLLSLSAALALSSASPMQCTRLEGIDKIAAESNLRWLVVGEQHGTNETPAIFGDLVCALSRRQSVSVGLELPEAMQPFLDRYIESDGKEMAKKEFLSYPLWKAQLGYGSTSEAMFRLIDTLRTLHISGNVNRVFAIQPQYRGSQADFKQVIWEEQMASYVMQLATDKSLMVILVGNLHGRKSDVGTRPLPFRPMASYLPATETISLLATANGGTAWNCRAASDCGATPYGNADTSPRGITYYPAGTMPYDGKISVGGGSNSLATAEVAIAAVEAKSQDALE